MAGEKCIMLDADYVDACNAVREKGGSTSPAIKSGDLGTAIRAIPTGGGGNVEPEKVVDITSNGEVPITPSDGFDSMAKVTAKVNVPAGGAPQTATGEYTVVSETNLVLIDITDIGFVPNWAFAERTGDDPEINTSKAWIVLRDEQIISRFPTPIKAGSLESICNVCLISRGAKGQSITALANPLSTNIRVDGRYNTVSLLLGNAGGTEILPGTIRWTVEKR